MYRSEMLYTHFTRHGTQQKRLFLPPRGPVYPGLLRSFQLLHGWLHAGDTTIFG